MSCINDSNSVPGKHDIHIIKYWISESQTFNKQFVMSVDYHMILNRKNVQIKSAFDSNTVNIGKIAQKRSGKLIE